MIRAARGEGASQHLVRVLDVDLEERRGEGPAGLGVDDHEARIADPRLGVDQEAIGIHSVGLGRLDGVEHRAEELEETAGPAGAGHGGEGVEAAVAAGQT